MDGLPNLMFSKFSLLISALTRWLLHKMKIQGDKISLFNSIEDCQTENNTIYHPLSKIDTDIEQIFGLLCHRMHVIAKIRRHIFAINGAKATTKPQLVA